MSLRYGSVCSGIEAVTTAWHPLGWQPQFFSEIEAAPRAVLSHRWPEVPLHGDFTTIREGEYGAIDLLVGGTPCQDFSVAGLRAGLDGERGNLTLEFGRLAGRFRPQWVAWENVPGVLSNNEGRDFAAVLGLLTGQIVSVPAGGWQNSGVLAGYRSAYGVAWRVLDAQYVRVDGFGRAVPQRRRRVFVVGCLGDWRRPAAVLLERACLRGDPAPRREAGQRPAPTLSARPSGGGGLGTDFDCDGGLIAAPFAPAISASNPYGDHESREGLLAAHSLRGEGFDASEDGTGRGTPIVPVARTLISGGHSNNPLDENLVAFDTTQITSATNRCNPQAGDPCHPLAAGAHAPAIAFHGAQDPDVSGDVTHPVGRNGGLETCIGQGWAVRRLTPLECERLQGFPDGHTLVPWRGGMMPDGPRYKMLGNSMAVNCMRWIGRRIEAVEAITNAIARAA